ncbi:histone-lysine N-methyltransferase 2B-like, partial [Myiozetetes cayanensis]|uniref:histone-lysine N-methyltransferase 2B-like n=1 Tax=Myiozetetes cayanensis TaxID=478635 RepID=UPI00215DE090
AAPLGDRIEARKLQRLQRRESPWTRPRPIQAPPSNPPAAPGTRRHLQDWGPPGALGPPQNGWGRGRGGDGGHRVRVDFKEDCALENVWLMGGLSIVSSVPVTTPLVCLLCASKGLHQLVLCQVCCQPFHTFCLGAGEGPGPGQAQTWSCRRCKSCGVCARRGRHNKPLLECGRCRRCFHPACLGSRASRPRNLGSLQGGLQEVLGGLLSSPHGPALLTCQQCLRGPKITPGPATSERFRRG